MKKGFTLIELLAVILILGIIALIAIPTVTNMIEESKRGALRTTALTLVKQAQQACTSEMIKGLEPTLFYTINDGKASGELNTKNLPKSGEIELDSTCKSKVAVSDGKYCVITDGDTIDFKEDASKCVLNDVVYTAEKCFVVRDNVLEGFKYDDEDCNTNTIVVPATVNGEQIKETYYNSFRYEEDEYTYGIPTNLTLIDMSNMKYLEKIGHMTFYPISISGCNFRVELPKFGNLKILGSGSFQYYKHELQIPEGVTTIEYDALDLRNVASITIPSTVTTIERSAFGYSSIPIIINKTGRAFDWKDIFGAQTCSSEGEFVTGTCTEYDSTVIEIRGA